MSENNNLDNENTNQTNKDIADEDNDEVVDSSKRKFTFSQIFWITIFGLLAIYMILIVLASMIVASPVDENNSTNSSSNIIQTVEIIVNSDRIKKNLEHNKTVEEIKKNLNKNISLVDKKIDKEIDKAFRSVYDNLDGFLDFHYSVVGGYSEIFAAAGGKISGEGIKKIQTMIENKLFGSDFSTRTKNALNVISNEYEVQLSDHFNTISQKATVKVDMNLNSEIINSLQDDISRNMNIQAGKASLGAVGLTAVIAKTVASKLAAKAGSKLVIKGGTKVTKFVISFIVGAGTGFKCKWCGIPVGIVTWFLLDEILVKTDEHYNRDKFKQDIRFTLEQQKSNMKVKLKKSYEASMRKMSNEILAQYKQVPEKATQRVKVKDKIGF